MTADRADNVEHWATTVLCGAVAGGATFLAGDHPGWTMLAIATTATFSHTVLGDPTGYGPDANRRHNRRVWRAALSGSLGLAALIGWGLSETGWAGALPVGLLALSGGLVSHLRPTGTD